MNDGIAPFRIRLDALYDEFEIERFYVGIMGRVWLGRIGRSRNAERTDVLLVLYS